MEAHLGNCLCGKVTYVAEGTPLVVAQCHCEECRKLCGTGRTVGAMFPVEAVTIRGDVSTFSYRSGKTSEGTKAFCVNYGSPIYGQNTRTPELGTMNAAPDLEIEVVNF